MQMVIQSEKDLKLLQGKFILQVDSETPTMSLMGMGWGFAKEKRLFLVCNYTLVDLYGGVRDLGDFERFKTYFNNYYKGSNERFHRLLTSKEIDYLASKLKKENY